MKSYGEFIDRKQREARRRLEILEKVLSSKGVEVKTFFKEEDEPYIFVRSPEELSFEGIRLYAIADGIAYRAQKKESTHPFGTAYNLKVEEMYDDLSTEKNKTKEQIGEEIMKSVANEVLGFFRKSKDAEKELRTLNIGLGNDNVRIRPTGAGLTDQQMITAR